MQCHTLSRVAFFLAFVLSLSAQSTGLISQVKSLAWAKDVQKAQEMIEKHRTSQNQITPEWVTAVSWLARGASFAEQWDVAEKYAKEGYEGSLHLLKKRPLDADSYLPIALGASIEVLGRVYDVRGDRAAAVEFLTEQLANYKGTSIETRLQKNLLLLGLDDKPFPGLESEQYVGQKPPTTSEVKGKVVLYYFWAHWCGDCKRQMPVLRELYEKYSEGGLVIVGPTRLYGYVARGEGATPQQELDYLKNAYQQKHPIPSWMGVPVGTQDFLRFGVSTTPTLILVDRGGIVRLYNPGTLSYEELAGRIEQLLS